MRGIYCSRSTCMSYQVHIYVCTDICLCITLPFTSTLVNGGVKGLPHHSSTKPCKYLGLLGILGFNILLQNGGINQ